MEKKNFVQYTLLVLIVFIVTAGLVKSFKTSDHLKALGSIIDSTKKLVDESMIILKKQENTIDSIKSTNVNLIRAMNGLETQNKSLRVTINRKFEKNFKDLDSIRASIADYPDATRPQ
jgi:hypothetical protein